MKKFCPNCGEKAEVKRITLGSMISDVFSTVTNMDKGFLYNLKNLTLNPQKITSEYINGKRKEILNPVSYLIYAVSIYLIIIIVFDNPKELSDIVDEPRKWLRKISYEAGYFIRAHLKYVWIFTIFPLALSLKIIFNKYNYIENLAISSLIIGHATLVSVLSYLIFSTMLIFDPLVYSVIFLLVLKIFGENRTLGDSFFWSIMILLMFIFLLVVLVILIAIIQVKF